MELVRERSSELVRVDERKSKLAGNAAWADIPTYLKKDIKKDFIHYKAYYQIDNLIGVYLVLDYGELMSGLGYSDRLRPGMTVPAGSINIEFYTPKSFGNEANYYSPVYIAPRYPSKSELVELVSRLREISSGWDFDLLSEIDDEEVTDYLQNEFRSSKSNIKDLKPRLATQINKSLHRLYLRLDRAAVPIVKKFSQGKKFGAYEVSRDF